ncbi:MAG TPA: histidine kinase [Saprospiraceae bacterium]|nr:histidine kinase [Saprospiraceae bacterium]
MAILHFGLFCSFNNIRLAIYLRISNLNKKLEIQNQINELEQAAKKAKMNPHFLFNTLNSVQSKILTGNLEDATHFLSLFGQLVRRVLDMSLQKSNSLITEIEYLTKYLELEQMRFKKRFQFNIIVDKELDQQNCFIAPMLVQPFIENSIIHGISNIDQISIININFLKESDYIQVEIKDNGIGFQYKSQGKSSLEKSVGISNTERRLELLDEPKTKNLLEIKELIDNNGNILGTQVILFIKIIP